MQIRVQVTLVEGDQNEVYELGSFERGVLQLETLGLIRIPSNSRPVGKAPPARPSPGARTSSYSLRSD